MKAPKVLMIYCKDSGKLGLIMWSYMYDNVAQYVIVHRIIGQQLSPATQDLESVLSPEVVYNMVWGEVLFLRC